MSTSRGRGVSVRSGTRYCSAANITCSHGMKPSTSGNGHLGGVSPTWISQSNERGAIKNGISLYSHVYALFTMERITRSVYRYKSCIRSSSMSTGKPGLKYATEGIREKYNLKSLMVGSARRVKTTIGR